MKILKYTLGTFLISTIVGCQNTIPTSVQTKEQVGRWETFRIQNTHWKYFMPNEWKQIKEQNSNEIITQAFKKSQNFIIIQKQGDIDRIAGSILGSGKDLYYFKEISANTREWEFQAKTSISSPLRHFIQKTFPVPNTEFYILASCSYEEKIEKNSDCKTIINSFEVSVDKT